MSHTEFDPDTHALLEPVTVGSLKFRSIRTGATYDAVADDTLLASNSEGQVDLMSKYRNTIRYTAYEPINPRMLEPCPKCKRSVTSFQRLGDNKKVIHSCLCGHKWTH